MTQLFARKRSRRDRVFPEHQLFLEKQAKSKAEDEVFARRCRTILNELERGMKELIFGNIDRKQIGYFNLLNAISQNSALQFARSVRPRVHRQRD
jgi:hypothetical protein